jgi:hypothetical protein
MPAPLARGMSLRYGMRPLRLASLHFQSPLYLAISDPMATPNGNRELS